MFNTVVVSTQNNVSVFTAAATGVVRTSSERLFVFMRLPGPSLPEGLITVAGEGVTVNGEYVTVI